MAIGVRILGAFLVGSAFFAACASAEEPVATAGEVARYLDLRFDSPVGADPSYVVFAASLVEGERMAFLAWGRESGEGACPTSVVGWRPGAKTLIVRSDVLVAPPPWHRGVLSRIPDSGNETNAPWVDGRVTQRLVLRVDAAQLERTGALVRRARSAWQDGDDVRGAMTLIVRAVARDFDIAVEEPGPRQDPADLVIGSVDSVEGLDWSGVFPPDLPFDPTIWNHGGDPEPLGDPRAAGCARGARFTVPWLGFPSTLRTQGPGSNNLQIRTVHALLYEPLLGVHPETEDFEPALASHWREEAHADGTRTFWFRIDPRARWADGRPVDSRDVHWSWIQRVRTDREDFGNHRTYSGGYEEPEILDRLTLRVRTRLPNWRLLLYFAGMDIYPAEALALPGRLYLERDERLLPMGSGPYDLDLARTVMGERVSLRRRADWWGGDTPLGRHLYNFDSVEFEVWPTREMIDAAFWAGDLDLSVVSGESTWRDLLRGDAVQRGWVQACRVSNEAPVGFSGLCFNMRRAPLDDRRVRLALCHLFPRERLIRDRFHGVYPVLDSYYPGRPWGNGPDNLPVPFDVERARALLAEAGYVEQNAAGYLVDAKGQELALTFVFSSPGWEANFRMVREAFAEGGVRLRLRRGSSAEVMRRASTRDFDIHWQGWGALLYPNPVTSWHSSQADRPGSNNLPGFQSDEVDRLCEEYDLAPDLPSRRRIVQKIDALVYAEHPYALGWYAPFFRLAWWNRFGHPPQLVSRIDNVPINSILAFWWVDPEKQAALDEARREGRSLPKGPRELRPWAERKPRQPGPAQNE